MSRAPRRRCIAALAVLLTACAAISTGAGKLLMVAFLVATDDAACGTDPVVEIPGPANGLKAVIFQYDCGATTPFTTNVSILPLAETFPGKPGNVLVAYGGSRRGPWGGPVVEVHWLAADRLEIACVHDARVSKRLSHHSGVRVAHELMPGA